MNEKLIEFIRKNVERGYDTDKIKYALVNAGHDIRVVEEHINHVIESQFAKTKKRKYVLITVIAIIIIIFAAGFYNFFNLNKKTKVANKYISGDLQNKNLELFNEALINNDESICKEIVDDKLKNECQKKLLYDVTNETAELCDESCRSKEILNKALISHNASLCIEIIDYATRKVCEQNLKT